MAVFQENHTGEEDMKRQSLLIWSVSEVPILLFQNKTLLQSLPLSHSCKDHIALQKNL
jgi:hypothetical protein